MHFVGGRDPGQRPAQRPAGQPHPSRKRRSTRSSVRARRWRCRSSRSAGPAGLHCHYIESAARSDGPSKTARMISQIPGVHLYTQYPAWADDKWHYRGAVFDSFVPVDEPLGRREPAAEGCRLARHIQRHRVRASRSDVCSRSCHATPTCSGKPATPTSAGLGSWSPRDPRART